MSSQSMGGGDVTSDDRLWGALSYLPFVGWIIAVVMLLMEDKRARPFIKFSAVQALILDVALALIYFVLSLTVVLAFCAWIIFFIPLWPAIEAYRGKMTQIPVVSNFIKSQGWA